MAESSASAPVPAKSFEESSSSDRCIAVDGELTPWRRRFARRAEIEHNWQKQRRSTLVLDVVSKHEACYLLERLHMIVIKESTTRLLVRRLSDCAVVQRVKLSDAVSVLPGCIAADDSQSPAVIATASNRGEVSVWSVTTGKRVGRSVSSPEGALQAIDVRGDCVASLAYAIRAGVRSVRVANWRSGQQLQFFDLAATQARNANFLTFGATASDVFVAYQSYALALSFADGGAHFGGHFPSLAGSFAMDATRNRLLFTTRREQNLAWWQPAKQPLNSGEAASSQLRVKHSAARGGRLVKRSDRFALLIADGDLGDGPRRMHVQTVDSLAPGRTADNKWTLTLPPYSDWPPNAREQHASVLFAANFRYLVALEQAMFDQAWILVYDFAASLPPPTATAKAKQHEEAGAAVGGSRCIIA